MSCLTGLNDFKTTNRLWFVFPPPQIFKRQTFCENEFYHTDLEYLFFTSFLNVTFYDIELLYKAVTFYWGFEPSFGVCVDDILIVPYFVLQHGLFV